MRRFTLTIPVIDNDGNPRTDFAQEAERLLLQAGFSGWTKLSGEGAWQQFREPVVVFVIDSEEADVTCIQAVGQELCRYAAQEAVYVTSEPVETFLVTSDFVPSAVPSAANTPSREWGASEVWDELVTDATDAS